MASIADNTAKISITSGAKRDSSGSKQLFDSGLLFDSGIYFDRWGTNPVQSEQARINFTKD